MDNTEELWHPSSKSTSLYKSYLRLDTLLHLQQPKESQVHPDELLFQIVHQTFELWWKETIQLLDRAEEKLASGKEYEAIWLIRRASSIQPLLVQVMHQLEALTPLDFLQIRAKVSGGSGADSPGFHSILKKAPVLWQAFSLVLTTQQIDLLELYGHADQYHTLYDCAEALLDFDEQFSLFRLGHLKLAERYLGPSATGTGGVPVPILRHAVHDRLFPLLWQVRGQLLESI